jgi:predicted nucleic acid-binding protein
LFREADRFDGVRTSSGYLRDPADRKFAALADAANVPLVTSDRGLLNARGQAPFPILKPSEFALDH